jgi:tRNA G10  N-methylase Trm11
MNMIKYIFFLGRKPLLSLAELIAVLPMETAYLYLQKEFLSVSLPEELQNPQNLLDRLGGTTKIVQVSRECASGKLAQTISDLATEMFQGRTDKIRYGISLHSMTGSSEKNLKNSLMLTKKKLKNAGLSSRFVNNNFQNPPTALVTGENLLQKGAEFNGVEMGSNSWQIGHTVAIQNINAYSSRDYERPERDPRLGMLPPKLAQIMINLSGAQPGAALYDPFCGIGTILMEGLLMGMNVTGSDLSPENISKCHKNLDWLVEQSMKQAKAGNGKAISAKFQLFQKDATKILKSDLPRDLSAVISETFLGPPVSRTPTPSQIQETQAMIENLLAGFLTNLKPLLTPEASVVLTLLAYRDGRDYITLGKLHQHLEKLGFRQEKLIPQDIQEKLNLPAGTGEEMIYERPDQTVCREVIKLKLL